MTIPRKYSPLLFATLMGATMSFIMSLTLTLINVGFVSSFFQIWFRAFTMSFIVSIPTALIVAPVAQKIVAGVTRPVGENSDEQAL